MWIERRVSCGLMEGSGFYNLHARIPAAGGALALPHVEDAARKIAIDGGKQPIVIADYGSSQGKNSLAPMRAAIMVLRTRVDPDRPIFVVHVDQPANDFNTLFEVLDGDPERYSVDDPNVFPSAVGRSFYESVFPREYVHLAWSSYAAVWLSRIPSLLPDHFISLASGPGEVSEVFARQAADDWELFLSLRASELRAGGRLVVVLPGVREDGTTGFETLFRRANEALSEMLADGLFTPDERAGMTVGSYPRRRREILAPFNTDKEFQGLRVENCEQFGLSDTAWTDYEHDGNRERLAQQRAAFFRSVFVPSLTSALTDPGKKQVFADTLEQKLTRRLVDEPARSQSNVQIMVLAKKT